VDPRTGLDGLNLNRPNVMVRIYFLFEKSVKGIQIIQYHGIKLNQDF
jgi:hypothetical protein